MDTKYCFELYGTYTAEIVLLYMLQSLFTEMRTPTYVATSLPCTIDSVYTALSYRTMYMNNHVYRTLFRYRKKERSSKE